MHATTPARSAPAFRAARPATAFAAARFAALMTAALFATLFVTGAHATDARYPDARRIVSIGGSLTEIIYALGEEDRLVGRDSTSVYPQAAFGLPDVGYMRALSPEGVLSIKPDLILLLEGSGPPEAIAVLEGAGIPFVEVPETFNAEGIATKIDVVGTAIGVEEKAAALKEKVLADLADAQAAAAAGKTRKVLFILSMLDGRIMASGTQTAADGIIAMAGARNAIDAYPGYKPLNDEAIIEAAPEIILMMDRGGGHSVSPDELFTHPAIALTPAAKGRHLVRMDGAFLLGFGPRTAQSISELAQTIDTSFPNDR